MSQAFNMPVFGSSISEVIRGALYRIFKASNYKIDHE